MKRRSRQRNLIVTVIAFGARPARAERAAKADFSYRDSPKDGKSCASCRLSTPPGPDKGSCAVVEGDVSSEGSVHGVLAAAIVERRLKVPRTACSVFEP